MAKKKSNKSSFKSKWLLVAGAFIILFTIFYYALSHRAYTPKETSQTTTTGESEVNRYDAPKIIKSRDGEESIWHNSYYPQILFSLKIPAECEIGKQSSHDVMPNFANITCNEKGIVIIPYAGGHGMGGVPGIKITTQTSTIMLGKNNWQRVIFSSNIVPKTDKVSTYTLQGNNSLMIEIDYSNYSQQDQDLFESILSSLKFTQ